MKYGTGGIDWIQPHYYRLADGFARLTEAMISSGEEARKLWLVLDRRCNEAVKSLTEGERKYYDALVYVGTPRLNAIVEARRLCRRYYRPRPR